MRVCLFRHSPMPQMQSLVSLPLDYTLNLIRHHRVRRTAITLFVLAFLFAGIAGAFGAFITKVAPVK
jgi:hypothetical protein